MESHGTADRIQITRATFELLRDEFNCEPRGRVPVKGKGEMETWYLVGRRAEHSDRTQDAESVLEPTSATAETQ
jgi:class 3 adenylate cyclase